MTDRTAFAPNAVDRALDRLQRATPTMNRLSHVGSVVIVAVFGGLDLFFVGVSNNGLHPWGIRVATLVLVIIAVVGVAVRRRRAELSSVVVCAAGLATTAVVVAAGGQGLPSVAMLFALALLAANVLRSSSGPVALALVVLTASAVAGEALRLDEALAASAAVVFELCFAVAVGIGLYLRWSDWRRRLGEAAARADERLELARELHDLVGHYVTGMVVQAQAAQHVAADRPDVAVEALGRIEVAGSEAMAAMRRMVGGLRDDAPVSPGAGWDDIESLVADAVVDGLPARLHLDPDVRRAPTELSSSAFRIVTEALTNVRRHARDITRVEVDVAASAGRLVVSISDDGTSALPGTHDTYGLVGMRERAEALGGTLSAGPGPAGGWLVVAEVPLEPAS